MADPGTIPVPNVVGSTQAAAEAMLKSVGLAVGGVTTSSSATMEAGKVSNANPAGGILVSSGSPVSLEVSSGPASTSAQVAVPDVVGFTELAAEATLKNSGLVVGQVTTASSNTVPPGGVSSTSPAAGTLVSPASAIVLEVSSGQKKGWTHLWTVLLSPAVIFAALGSILLGLIVMGVYGNAGILISLANKEVARGLITFLIAITTVGIAVILALSTIILKGGADDDKRFDRGKQVLTMLIGVLGTIVGFYFGSDVKPIPLAITTVALPAGTANKPYPSTTLQTKGGTPPLKWSVKPTLPAKLELDPTTGTISGTPTIASPEAKFAFTVTDSAAPAASSTADLALQIKPPDSSASASPTPSATP